MERDIFVERMNELYATSECPSVTQFAKLIGLKRQTVDKYLNGKQKADMPSIRTICSKMNISSDWLLGLSDIKSQSADIIDVVNVLGITEEAASRMIEFKCGKAFSQMAESEFFREFIENYQMFLSLVEKINAEKDFYDLSNQCEIGSDSVTLKSVQAARFFQQETSGMMGLVLEEAYYKRINKTKGKK